MPAIKPTEYPQFAVNPDGTASSADIIEPTEPQKLTGWLPAVKPPSQTFNWLHSLVARWSMWFDQQEQDHESRIDSLETFETNLDSDDVADVSEAVTGANKVTDALTRLFRSSMETKATTIEEGAFNDINLETGVYNVHFTGYSNKIFHSKGSTATNLAVRAFQLRFNFQSNQHLQYRFAGGTATTFGAWIAFSETGHVHDAGDITTGTFPNARIGVNAIENDNMANNSVDTPELVDYAVTTNKFNSSIYGGNGSAVTLSRSNHTHATSGTATLTLTYGAVTSSMPIKWICISGVCTITVTSKVTISGTGGVKDLNITAHTGTLPPLTAYGLWSTPLIIIRSYGTTEGGDLYMTNFIQARSSGELLQFVTLRPSTGVETNSQIDTGILHYIPKQSVTLIGV